ncbi:isoleucyl-tRNA synthetase, mitochondrial [Dermacentor variabilis]|uniref:isoleucyl-tRNA synthetase, mitochondrial n=1 Tax=Dermacentor variabilis TaxID=34621 RepID=UPI003F5B810C
MPHGLARSCCVLSKRRPTSCLQTCIRKSSKISYSGTVLLPKTGFPQRITGAKRSENDEKIAKYACFEEHYAWQRENNKGPHFILHDGPPYANGDTHLGHAVNKILKDITIRYHSLRGDRVHFVPGWDCHGLPIETKALTAAESHGTPTDVRSKAHSFASATIQKQMNSFKHWGVMANWKKPYRTFDVTYVTKQIEAFYDLYEKGYVFRDFKPVYWSPSNRTALAEAELEYNVNHVSKSVYVAFPLVKVPDAVRSVLSKGVELLALIWTTTPWTLPANQAICFSSKHQYSIVRMSTTRRHLLVASDLVSYLQQKLKEDLEIVATFTGSDMLSNATYAHPLYPDKELRFLPGDFVTMDKGTGLVHSAPSHGFEDYQNALKHSIAMEDCLVDEEGRFTSSCRPELRGLPVLTEGSEAVTKLLANHVIQTGSYTHSYPYDWRSKQPVIVRSSRQWFINLDDDMRQRALDCLKQVQILPESARTMFENQLAQRPHWCISRQRYWGVPIPVVFQDERSLTSREFIRHVCNLMNARGPDVWWTATDKELLPDEVREQLGVGEDAALTRGRDIMDIWLDSGLSWKMVLPEPCQADVYLEGLDQVRGWFQSSLLTSVALTGRAPYRKLYMHGFTLDAEGRKMSKSLGNVIDPETITKGGKDLKKDPAFGVDVLRWWVAAHTSNHENVPVAKHVLAECQENVAKLRGTLRFCLGALSDFDHSHHVLPYEEMLPLDRFMLHLLGGFHNRVMSLYDEMRYNHACSAVLNFVVNEASSFYFQAVKDRLYCDVEDSVSRRSCQTALSHVLDVLVKLTAPVVPHLAEEVFYHHADPGKYDTGVFRRVWRTPPNNWERPEFSQLEKPLAKLREAVNKAVAKSRPVLHDIKIITARGDSPLATCLRVLQPEDAAIHSGLTDVLQVASVTFEQEDELIAQVDSDRAVIVDAADEKMLVVLEPTKMAACERCRRNISSEEGRLCTRCEAVYQRLNFKWGVHTDDAVTAEQEDKVQTKSRT